MSRSIMSDAIIICANANTWRNGKKLGDEAKAVGY
jgi:hypothetical protein